MNHKGIIEVLVRISEQEKSEELDIIINRLIKKHERELLNLMEI